MAKKRQQKLETFSLTPAEMRRAAALYKTFNAPIAAAKQGARAGSKAKGFDEFGIAVTKPLEKATKKPSWKLARELSSQYAGQKGKRKAEERGRTALRLEREATRKSASKKKK
jgi:hypothetical protein